MADILDYTELTAPTSADAMYIVDDPSGTPIDKYILIQNMDKAVDKTIEIVLLGTGTALSTGDDFASIYFTVPELLDGRNLIDVDFALASASTSGTPTFQLYNVTDSVDMLSTKVTIDENELTSYTATTPAVVDTTNDDVATGDMIRFDCDDDGNTGALGCTVIMKFRKP